jgi:hypothetical protein
MSDVGSEDWGKPPEGAPGPSEMYEADQARKDKEREDINQEMLAMANVPPSETRALGDELVVDAEPAGAAERALSPVRHVDVTLVVRYAVHGATDAVDGNTVAQAAAGSIGAMPAFSVAGVRCNSEQVAAIGGREVGIGAQ